MDRSPQTAEKSETAFSDQLQSIIKKATSHSPSPAMLKEQTHDADDEMKCVGRKITSQGISEATTPHVQQAQKQTRLLNQRGIKTTADASRRAATNAKQMNLSSTNSIICRTHDTTTVFDGSYVHKGRQLRPSQSTNQQMYSQNQQSDAGMRPLTFHDQYVDQRVNLTEVRENERFNELKKLKKPKSAQHTTSKKKPITSDLFKYGTGNQQTQMQRMKANLTLNLQNSSQNKGIMHTQTDFDSEFKSKKELKQEKRQQRKMNKQFQRLWTKQKQEYSCDMSYIAKRQPKDFQLKNESYSTAVSEKKIVPKSLTVYRKREKEFQQKFDDQLLIWEQERLDDEEFIDSSDEDQPVKDQKLFNEHIPYDTQIYKERNDDYPIVGNKILQRAVQPQAYLNKPNHKILSESFDPIRIRLRIISIYDAPCAKGMNADYYFKEAGKKSMRGELTKAIELLKRGLLIQPKHYLCRHNHGILMFKFGLVVEATQDFYQLTQEFPEKFLPYYNLSICLIQLGLPSPGQQVVNRRKKQHGLSSNKVDLFHDLTPNQRYEMIIELCKTCIQLAKQELNSSVCAKEQETKLTIVDAYFLAAIAHYRLARPLEAVNCFQTGKRFRGRFLTGKMVQKSESNQLLKAVTIKIKGNEGMLSPSREVEHTKESQENLEPFGIVDDLKVLEVAAKHKEYIDEHCQQDHHVEPPEWDENIRQQALKDLQEFVEDGQPQNPIQVKRVTTVQSGVVSQPQSQNQFSRKITSALKSQSSKSPNKSQVTIKNETSRKSLEQAMVEYLIEEMQKVRDRQVDQGSNVRYKKILAPEHDVDNGFIDEGLFLTEVERQELQKRSEHFQWVIDNPQAKQALEDHLNEQFLLKPKNSRVVAGSDGDAIKHIQSDQNELIKKMTQLEQKFKIQEKEWDKELEEGKKQINQLQITHEDIACLKRTNDKKTKNTDMAFQRNNQQLIERLKQALIAKNNMTSDDVVNLLENDMYEREKIKYQLEHAAKIMNSQRFTCKHLRILEREFERPLLERNVKVLDQLLSHLRYFKRLQQKQRHLFYNSCEFVSFKAQKRIFSQGDIGDYMYVILKGKVSVKVSLPGRDTVQVLLAMPQDGECFGELSLYDMNRVDSKAVNVKHVGVEKQEIKQEYKKSVTSNESPHPSSQNGGGNFSSQVMTPELQKESQQQQPVKKDLEVRRRAGTCTAVEETFMLRVDHTKARDMLQPDFKQKTRASSRHGGLSKQQSVSSLGSQSDAKKSNNNSRINTNESRFLTPKFDNEIGKKIDFLKNSFQFFQGIDNKQLMPIAVNMQQVNFAYGDYLQKEGEVPKGLYLIKSGQCIVCKFKISEREHKLSKVIGFRRMLKDKHQLFNDFDVENSLLNNCKIESKAAQNTRVFVTEKGEQIRDKIQYQDLAVFKKLAPKNWFGGRVIMPYELYLQLRRLYFGQEYINRPKKKEQIISGGGDVESKIQEKEPESDETYQLKSFLNVIADSGVVETYLITKAEMQYLQDSELKIIFDWIAQQKEPDRSDTQEAIEQRFADMRKWEKQKIKLMDEVVNHQQLQKNFRTGKTFN